MKQLRWNIIKHKKTGMNDPYPYIRDKAHINYEKIRTHRIKDVRHENRATFLARDFLSGKTYESVEQKRKCEWTFRVLIFPRFVSMVVKYGPRDKSKRTWDFKSQKNIITDEYRQELKNWANLK